MTDTLEIVGLSFKSHSTILVEIRCNHKSVHALVLTIEGEHKVDLYPGNTISTQKTHNDTFNRFLILPQKYLEREKLSLTVTALSDKETLEEIHTSLDIKALSNLSHIKPYSKCAPGHLISRYRWRDNIEMGLTTIVLGVYNGEPFVKEAIESVLRQTSTNIQFIIVDDASTDNTRTILQKYGERDSRIELVLKDQNEGQGAAFNAGIERARGDLTCFLDADDYWFENKVAAIRSLFAQDPMAKTYAIYQHRLNICYGTELSTEPFRPSLIDGDVLNHCLKEKVHIPGPFSPTAGLAFPTEILRCVYPIPKTFRICADGFLTRAATTLGHSRATNEALGAYRIHADNNTVENETFDQQDYIHHMLKPAVNMFYRQNNIEAFIPILGRSRRQIPLNKVDKKRDENSVIYLPKQAPQLRTVRDFKNIHKGQRAFIVATGPSLKIEDLDALKDEITFSCNKITLAFDETDWRPTYYSIIDSMVYENFDYNWSSLPSIKFFPDDLRSKYSQMKDAFFIRNRTPIFDDNGERLFEFSEDISENIAGGYTVIYFLMQLAFYMGIEELYILGLDFSFSYKKISSESSSKGESLIENSDEVNHFHKSYRPEGEKWTIPRLDLQEKAFKKAKETFEAHDRKIVNASRATKLELFERASLREALCFPNNSDMEANAPIMDIYGDMLYATYCKETSRLEIKGWLTPEPTSISVYYQGKKICSGTSHFGETENEAIAAPNGIYFWSVDSNADIQAGDYIRIVFEMSDGTCFALADQIQSFALKRQKQTILQQNSIEGSIARRLSF
ncbi:MAG: glycosyltransferase [Kordiimonas sp.]